MVSLYSIVALSLAVLPAFAQQPLYGQCGGNGWNGQTTCVSGAVCTKLNDWYSQCLPGTAAPVTTTAVPSATTNAPPTSTGATGLNIRLLPLGDSITFGLSSGGGNGYRSTLHTLLEPGNTVDFIGSVKAGTMADNDNEGHSGATIDQIASFARAAQALPARPNIVLLMAGTNDVFGGSISTAPNRLSSLIDQVFTAAPDTALIVATLTPLSSGQSSVNTYNQAITSLVNTRNAAGQHILLADMGTVQSSDLADGVHPNDSGYNKMANAWFSAIQKAEANGWIGQPITLV